MSEIGRSFTDVPALLVGASQAKVGAAGAGRTNGALQLAGALSELNPKLAAVGQAVIKEDMEVQGIAAKKLAVETGGKQLADAVREGRIEATQNPYFIQDYNRESAYVRAQNQIDQIRLDAQTWEEQSDPVAFRERYLKAISEIGKGYTDPDSMEGFQAAAGPAIQQDFAANTAAKAAAIKADRTNVMANLVAQQITSVQSANGGRPAPNQVWEAITPLKEQFLSTGGTDADWDKLVLNGVSAVALQQGNAGLMDLLKDSKSGTKGSIYNLPGVAPDVETTKYRITQDQQEKGRQAYYESQQADYFAQKKATELLYNKYGVRAFNGSVPVEDLVKTLTDAGTPANGVLSTISKVQSAVNDFEGLSESRFKGFARTGEGQQEILDLYMQARTQGYTPELEQRLSHHVLSQNIPASTANDIIGQSLETNRANGNGRVPPSVRRTLQSYSSTGSTVDRSVTDTAKRLNTVLTTKGATRLSPQEISAVQKEARRLANYYLEVNPGDMQGATAEAQRAVAELFRQQLEKRMKNIKGATK